MCKTNFIPISIGVCVIALQIYREIVKKYRERAITLKKKIYFFKNLRNSFLDKQMNTLSVLISPSIRANYIICSILLIIRLLQSFVHLDFHYRCGSLVLWLLDDQVATYLSYHPVPSLEYAGPQGTTFLGAPNPNPKSVYKSKYM